MYFLQLGKSMGPTLLQFLLGLLKHLVIHSEQLDAQNQQKLEAARAESDLFLDMESVASLELATDKVLPSPHHSHSACYPFPTRLQILASSELYGHCRKIEKCRKLYLRCCKPPMTSA